MTKIYLVGTSDAEATSIKSVHRTAAGARKAWNDLRLELIKDFQERIDDPSSGIVLNIDAIKKMYDKMIKNLQCEDPETIDNYPHDVPFIREMELLE